MLLALLGALALRRLEVGQTTRRGFQSLLLDEHGLSQNVRRERARREPRR